MCRSLQFVHVYYNILKTKASPLTDKSPGDIFITVLWITLQNVLKGGGSTGKTDWRRVWTDFILRHDGVSGKGYTDASLRDIAAKAGTTTGSIYTRFGDKEGLFEAIVGTHYRYLTEKFKNALAEFYKLPDEEKPEHMGKISQNCMKKMLQYGLAHQKEFYLILCKSEGTRFSGMLDEFIEAEIKSTDDYLETLAKLGRPAPEISPHLKHIIVTAMFNGFLKLLFTTCRLKKRRVIWKNSFCFWSGLEQNYGTVMSHCFCVTVSIN